ncbi:MAG: 50S ribosomal protein L24 [Cenarchaeum sp. SB0665_bin_23]|nr:50S ribosomal protein L24 [Cenarchaeum sp. SB0667_bin_13]MXY37496.1 50S ribosomal protein L24 [Cenarchaeum sp. SB0664_bin_35]MXY61207.1 50S ribosomal protein L24 [Cenarchaeum sp. SB0665_bin_23]MXZ93918.1 50S ribosomal protein L24 [Cenarchaeum sp. SB0666_bin_15]MYB46873.1 50S ribosomal protein L24 [Cenarchaeum sp. SB0662_bin_33]MYC80011.1 50S ribosomal protein L24 [Cenarchaeum sp. SB0661_bin_35]MYD59383.1 50S ribosomal protein L24 [Cenarchaeum sp. SB0678_bin_8]MYG33600.1 50S ribosomal prot
MRPSKIRNRTIHKAPLSVLSKMMSSHLSGELRKSHAHRSFRIVPGDSVLIKRGVYKGVDGKVEKIDLRLGVAISGIQDEKIEGKKIDIYIHPSNLVITALNLDDKWRAKKLKVDPARMETSGQAGAGVISGQSTGTARLLSAGSAKASDDTTEGLLPDYTVSASEEEGSVSLEGAKRVSDERPTDNYEDSPESSVSTLKMMHDNLEETIIDEPLPEDDVEAAKVKKDSSLDHNKEEKDTDELPFDEDMPGAEFTHESKDDIPKGEEDKS